MKIIKLFSFLFITLLMYVSVYAQEASESVIVQKNESYSSEGKYYLSYTMTNIHYEDEMEIHAELYNESGELVVTWYYAGYMTPGETVTKNFGTNYNNLGAGQYTFKLIITYEATGMEGPYWYWTAKINHGNPSPSMTFKSYETIYDDYGSVLQKFNISCKNMEGMEPAIWIFDEDGSLVYMQRGKPIGGDSVTKWFTWNGVSDIGSGEQCYAGYYTVQFECDDLTVEEYLYLDIMPEVW